MNTSPALSLDRVTLPLMLTVATGAVSVPSPLNRICSFDRLGLGNAADDVESRPC
jgi:hypothetical protein